MTTDTQLIHGDLLKPVLLARLLNNKKPPSLRELARSLAKLMSLPGSVTEHWLQTHRQELEIQGLLAVGKWMLTEQGEQHALRFLSLSKAPTPRARHQRIKLAVFAQQLGKSVDQVAQLDKSKLAALLLRRKYDLPTGSGNTLHSALEALVCQLLGFKEAVKLTDLIVQKLSQEHGCRYDARTVKTSGIATLLGISQFSKDKLIQSVVARSTATPVAPKQTEIEDFDQDAFVETVLKAAREVPTGRFRDDLVFINHVWHYLSLESPFCQMGLDTFKKRLVEANREQKLHLIRADFPVHLSPNDIQESACEDLGSYFHFIQLDRNRNHQ